MADNIDNSTLGFFGDPDARNVKLRSIAGYLFVGGAIIVSIAATIWPPLSFMLENRKERLHKNVTFWGGFVGYCFGIIYSFSLLGIPLGTNIVYKNDNNWLQLQLGDPELAYAWPILTAVITGGTTLTGLRLVQRQINL